MYTVYRMVTTDAGGGPCVTHGVGATDCTSEDGTSADYRHGALVGSVNTALPTVK